MQHPLTASADPSETPSQNYNGQRENAAEWPTVFHRSPTDQDPDITTRGRNNQYGFSFADDSCGNNLKINRDIKEQKSQQTTEVNSETPFVSYPEQDTRELSLCSLSS